MKTNSKLDSFPDKSFTLSLTVAQTDIAAEKQLVLTSLAANFENKGFRKGKAPISVVESQTAPDKLLEEVINSLLSKIYADAVSAHQLKPATTPVIKITNPPFALDKDWQIEISGAQIPDITINAQFFTDVTTINQNKDLDKAKKTDEILKKLIGRSQTQLARLIIDNDLNRKLSDLVDQTQQAGITVDTYLKNRHQSLDDYKKEMEHRIAEEWTLNLAISHIAADKNIHPEDAEIKDVIQKNPNLASNPDLIHYLLTQQKVIDFLLAL